jgi:uncharacterized membrane protein (TIGR02234 family)
VRGSRGYRLALVVLLAGAVAVIVAYGRTWTTTVVVDPGLPTVAVTLSGSDLDPAGAALGLVGLAGVAGLVATRRTGRIVTGVALSLAGVAVLALALRFALTWSSGTGSATAITRLVAERTGATALGVTTATSWWLLAAVGGALVAAAGIAAVAYGATWPTLGRRYDSSTAAGPAADRTRSAWDRLDDGEDPTADEDPAGRAGGA